MKQVSEVLGGPFRNVVLPGTIVAIGVHPHLTPLLQSPIGALYPFSATVLFVVEVVAFGLVISSASRRICYVYEGFSLTWLTSWMVRRHQTRVKDLSERLDQLWKEEESPAEESPAGKSQEREPQPAAPQAAAPRDADRRQERISLLTEKLADYPRERGDDGEPGWRVGRPTLLGNIIETYELYPESRYGIDATFYWEHILHTAPESIREEFAEAEEFAASLLLSSAAGAIAAIIGAGFGIAVLIGNQWPSVVLFTTPVPAAFSLVAIAFGAAVFFAFYWFSLPAFRNTRAKFRATTDLAAAQLDETLTKVAEHAGPAKGARAEALRRYLGMLWRDQLDAGDEEAE